ncbi:MAG TPA: hydrogenase iron-sulfur subunit, partial [Longimicrobiales bacterium]|nr:hydrogenase iron-sulfur subunit [Longimicrobiales bacterium]
LYGWQYNPIYQSGTLVVGLMVVLVVTGLYLTVFYRLAAPYESIVRLQQQVLLGRWIRALHRYAADAALVFAVVHALRVLLQNRSWGPRALAWVSGVVLLGLILVCGWTGYVMVWDIQGQVLAMGGARLFDTVPIFSEPISRTFVGERALPSAFFFLNLFAHIALPVGLLLVLWVHVSRVARPVLLPPRALRNGGLLLLFVLSVVWPAALGAKANLLALPERAPYDIFYSWWLPLANALSPTAVWLSMLLTGALLMLVPVITRPRKQVRPQPSVVDERLCTGCEQCYHDCPYEAITMLARADGRETLVAHVNSDLCTSCGICAGSCAPMGVGPPDRTGRDQLRAVKSFVAARRPTGQDVIIIACERGAGALTSDGQLEGCRVLPVSCGGNLHTSVVEYLIRAGAGGVLIAACPPRDCWNREGTIWLEQRLYHDREAELQARVDRRRIELVYASALERGALRAALEALRSRIALIAATAAEDHIDLTTLCEPPSPAEVSG